MNIETKQTITSTAEPGLTFTVRRLNMIQRAKRDAKIAEQRLEYTRLSMELRGLTNELIGTEGTPEEKAERIRSLPPEKRDRMMELQHRTELILHGDLIPATITAGLVTVQNGDKSPTVEQFLEAASDELISEVYLACEAGAALSEEQQKN